MKYNFLILVGIAFSLIICATISVNAVDHDPTASRYGPSGSSVTVSQGDSQGFTVEAQDSDSDLNYVEWYVGGSYQETDSVSGSSDYSTFSKTFSSEGTLEVKAIVYDSRNNGSHIGTASWTVTASSPPVRVITFSGYNWVVKYSGDSKKGPGPNYWSDSSDNVWVDSGGQLHLKITNRNGNWYCPEIYSDKTFGYGEYIFFVATRVDNMDKNVVGGLFTYEDRGETTPKEHEIDIEFSTWNNTILQNNSLYVFQYRIADGDPETDNETNKIPSNHFNMHLNGEFSTHKFTWKNNYLHFQSYNGHYDNLPSKDYLIAEKTFDNSNIPSNTTIPPESKEKVRMNLWLIDGQPPSDGKEVEIIIKKFEFKGCEPHYETKCYEGDVYYYGSCGNREEIYDNCISKPTTCGYESCLDIQKPSWSCSGESCSYKCVSSSDCGCEPKYLDEYQCNDNQIQQKYQNPDCSITWENKEYCENGCNSDSNTCNKKGGLADILDRIADFFSNLW